MGVQLIKAIPRLTDAHGRRCTVLHGWFKLNGRMAKTCLDTGPSQAIHGKPSSHAHALGEPRDRASSDVIPPLVHKREITRGAGQHDSPSAQRN